MTAQGPMPPSLSSGCRATPADEARKNPVSGWAHGVGVSSKNRVTYQPGGPSVLLSSAELSKEVSL